jgi:hypothetical protein
MLYISKTILGPTSSNPAIRLCCDFIACAALGVIDKTQGDQFFDAAKAVQSMFGSQPVTQEKPKKTAIDSSFLRPNANQKVNMLLINQIAETISQYIRLLFLISSLFVES